MRLKNIIIIAILGLFLVGCTNIPGTPNTGTYQPGEVFNPQESLEPQTFKSVEELNSFIRSKESRSYYSPTYMVMETRDMALSAVADGAVAESATTPTDYSETNVQVEGVDEADIIKTDGEYIYTVSGKTLFVIKAYPGEEAEILSEVEFENRPKGLFIDGDKIAVFGYITNSDFYEDNELSMRNGMTFFNIYDVSDKEEPELIKEYSFEGRYFEGRMTDENIYLILDSQPFSRVQPPMPIIMEGDIVRHMPVENIIYYPVPYNNPHFVTVHAINVEDMDLTDSKSVTVEGSPNMYMSHNNIYISYTERINEYEIEQNIVRDMVEPELSASDQELIQKIKNVDDDVLSQAEKEQKIMEIIQSYVSLMGREERDNFQDDVEEKVKEELKQYEYFQYTIIHRLEATEGVVDVKANGKVPGHVINQFSMDEYEEVLRVATTVNPRWSRFEKERDVSTNHVLTLDMNLKIMDHLADLAEDERIYSTRFMDDRLYMVTFKQVDPFFVIDLSNPENIETLGELKIPGFSRYLHPYDENTIIGIGRDATETGRTQGLKISLFDVTNVESPEEVAQFVTEERYARSTAEYEHKAFLFSKEKELLVIPAYSHNWEEGESYNGAMVFHISKQDIELRGLIDHSDSAPSRYGSAVERSLYIEDLLYTKSPNLLRINEIEDLNSVKNIKLDTTSTDMPIY